jgi:hypothetical protein
LLQTADAVADCCRSCWPLLLAAAPVETTDKEEARRTFAAMLGGVVLAAVAVAGCSCKLLMLGGADG